MGAEASNNAKVAKAGGAAALAALSVMAFVASWEGERHRAYSDQGGVATVCIGETQNVDPARIYSHDECQAMLRRRLSFDYAPKVLACVPGFAADRRRAPFEAAIDASYNAGPAAFCRSRMARLFNAGRWSAGCDAFRGWRATINGRPSRGLAIRREGERILCRKGLK